MRNIYVIYCLSKWDNWGQNNYFKTDQIIAVGQAVQDQQEHGFIFIGQDYNYLMKGAVQTL